MACRALDIPIIRPYRPQYGPSEPRSLAPHLTNVIRVTAGANGSIATSGYVIVRVHTTKVFNITPNTGYKIADVQVDGKSITVENPRGFSYAFKNVFADHSISATFVELAKVTYTITATADANGSISPAGLKHVNEHENQEFTIKADSGYEVADVVVDGESVGRRSNWLFENVTANHTISAVFTRVVPTSIYDGTYKGTFNYKYRKRPSPSDRSPQWITVTLGVTLELKTKDIQNAYIYLDITRVLCSDWGFDALNGTPLVGTSRAKLPANPSNTGTNDWNIWIDFPNGADLRTHSGDFIQQSVSPDGRILSGSDWAAHNVKSLPLSKVGSFDYEFQWGSWDLIKQTGPDVLGVTPVK